MEQLGPLPSVDAVLNKLKSDGTFDQFRKTCLSSIEGEPSFRAYSEHIEVVSRRYLQNYKWRESTTKNQVRGKLKDHAIGVIAGPDIQVGMPLPSVVEKVLETKSKELLPKITEIVDQLRQVRSKVPESINTNSSTKPPDIHKTSNSVASASEPTISKLTEFGSLPIDIPGLNLSSNTSKKESPAVVTTTGTNSSSSSSHGNSDGKTVKGKSKVGDAVSSKDIRSGGPVKTKQAQGTGNANKPVTIKESSKQKEKDEKGTSSKGSDDTASKATKCSSAKPKKMKDEAKETVVSGQKEESLENKVAPVISNNDNKVNESSDKKDTESKDQKTTSGKTETKGTKQGQTKPKDKVANKDKETESNDSKEKPATTRRSARLASLTESKDDTKKDGMDGEGQGAEDCPTEVAAISLEAERKPKGKKRSRANKSSQSIGRKRARMISSSSEDSKEEISSEDENQLQKDEKRTKFTKRKGKSRDTTKVSKVKSSRKRPLQHGHEEQAPVRCKKPKNESESKFTTHESPVEEEEHPIEQHNDSRPNKRKSKKPQRLPQRASKSPPIVITRYNRHVKPNRRYLDTSGNEAEAETKNNDEDGTKEGEATENTCTIVSGDSDFEDDNEGSEGGYSSCDDDQDEASSSRISSDMTSRTKTDRTE